MVKALVLDMDGVIFDSEPLHMQVTCRVMKDLAGREPEPDEFYEFVGVRNEEMWEALVARHKLDVTVEELLQRHREYKSEFFAQASLVPVEGIPELLAEAKKRGLKIALATSSPRFLAEMVLTRLGLIHYFDSLVTADDISHSKPDPEIYVKAAQRLALPPTLCVAVEDASLGAQAAKGAGMFCVGFRNPNSGNQDLSRADCVVNKINEIRPWEPEWQKGAVKL